MSGTESFDQFYRDTHRRVLTYLYAVCGDLSTAQDVTQEAYARAWQRWGRLAGYDDPEAWVRTVGWRLAAGNWRAARRWLVARVRLAQPDVSAGPSPDNVAIMAALAQIPPAQREAVVLHHLCGQSVAEIALATSSPAGTVKARLSRGRSALAVLLTDSWEATENV
ncbi:RNA polymerase sigma24 factor [Longispora fulva]|uniref:RNA polymerase sigma-70 factor (ECF subfamily) n=1 Tax=Longispora fulva TaxID=619741 RepID=A0A8J7GCB6_9ACTN|nr:SigE family RNA polymerase sigma factor [Longispora fulva]MBG6137928.1 RNA polymerase sigma-70 factor (ECF subfamily) [Longispora fulva]GIG60181.1 RNA polymerase sigma24 factor [Longispora fulva]